MGNRVKVEIDGLDEVLKHFESMRGVTTDVTDAVNQSTLAVEAQAKALAPVDTGNLRSSVHAVPATVGEYAIIGRVAAATEYAAYVEFGTGQRGSGSGHPKADRVSYDAEWAGMKAQPYMYPALNMNRQKIVKNIKSVISERMKK